MTHTEPMSDQIPEADWKLLRRLAPLALERFCAKVLKEATEITAAPGKTSHQRYLKLFRFLGEKDKDLAFAFDDHRRSTAMVKIARIHSLGLFTPEEFGEFSEDTRETVQFLISLSGG
jgi:hypothetical protein